MIYESFNYLQSVRINFIISNLIIEGFINHRQALVKLENIKELLLSQTYFQKKAELGTITFITSAYNFKKIPCLLFNDITNSLAIYTKIKQIRENNKNT